jgi:sulfatase modifying factor 1
MMLEAEWEYAAAGGAENRLVPWGGTAAPDCSHMIYAGCPNQGVRTVGSVPAGAGRWGHLDLAGNLWEFTVDEFASWTSAPCTDCANVAFSSLTSNRVIRGGDFRESYIGIARAAVRQVLPAQSIGYNIGFRCARQP